MWLRQPGVPPSRLGLYLGTSATSADVRSTAALGGKADLSRRPAPGSERTTKLVRVGRPQSSRAEGACPGRQPDAARCGPVRGPAPTPYSHTPPHAGARRHAASPMTLVDAHRAARRDSPVLPVRIFPVGLSRPNPRREA